MTYDPDNNTIRVAGYGDVPQNLGVKTYWKNFNPAHRHLLARSTMPTCSAPATA